MGDGEGRAGAEDTGATRIRWWWLVPAIAAPGLIIFVYPMVSLIARNGEHFDGAYRAGRLLYLVGALVVAAGVALWATRRSRVGRIAFTAYLLLAPAFVIYTLLAEVTRAVVLAVVLAAVVAVAVVIERTGRTRLVRSVAIISTVLLGAATLSTVLEVASPPQAETTASADDRFGPAPEIADRPSGADLPNVYHVILDEFQTDQFEAALDDEIRASLGGFTWYPDAMTTYGRTEMALADMFATSSYDYSVPPVEFVTDALIGPNSTLQQLRAAGYRTEGHIPSRSLWSVGLDPFDEVVLSSDSAKTDPGNDYAALASSMWVDANLPDALTKRMIPARHYEQLSTDALLPDELSAVSVQAFRSFVNSEQQQPATGRYAVTHLIVPHKPYVLGEDCSYQPGATTDGVAQARCGMTLVRELVDELDRLGRLDSSTIVVHGDHGAGLVREGDALDEIGGDLMGVPWSTARSRPLLLVKPAGADRSTGLTISDRPALTTDVMATVFDTVDLPITTSGDRASLVAPEFPDRPERAYHFYDKDPFGLPDGVVVRFVARDGVLAPGEEVAVPRRPG